MERLVAKFHAGALGLVAGCLGLPARAQIDIEVRERIVAGFHENEVSWVTDDAAEAALTMAVESGDEQIIAVGTSGTVFPELVLGATHTFRLYDTGDAPPRLVASRDTIFIPRPTKGIGVNFFVLALCYHGRAFGGTGLPVHRSTQQDFARQALDDLTNSGIDYVRFSASGWCGRDLDDWSQNPTQYWQNLDDMMADLDARGIQVIPSLLWRVQQFEERALGIACDPNRTQSNAYGTLVKQSTSASRALFYQWMDQFVTRYAGRSTIKFWELGNELNLEADITFTFGPPGMQVTKMLYTTGEMIAFTNEWATRMRGFDRLKLLGSGHSIPRKYSWLLWTTGSAPCNLMDGTDQFRVYLRDIHAGLDIVSIHLYNNWDQECNWGSGGLGLRNNNRFGFTPVYTGQFNADLIGFVKSYASSLGQLLFVGEYGDADPELNPGDCSTGGISAATPFNWQFADACLDEIVAEDVLYSCIWTWQRFNNDASRNPVPPHLCFEPHSIFPNIQIGLMQKLLSANAALGNPAPPLVYPDVVPPRVVILFPYPGTVVPKQAGATQTVIAVPSDDRATIQQVTFSFNGGQVTTDTTLPYEVVFNTGGIGPGPHTISVTATDQVGNTRTQTITVN